MRSAAGRRYAAARMQDTDGPAATSSASSRLVINSRTRSCAGLMAIELMSLRAQHIPHRGGRDGGAKRRATRCRWMTMTTTAEDRLRAARIQAGYNRREDLAEQITLPRFGKEVLGQVERGERPLFEH